MLNPAGNCTEFGSIESGSMPVSAMSSSTSASEPSATWPRFTLPPLATASNPESPIPNPSALTCICGPSTWPERLNITGLSPKSLVWNETVPEKVVAAEVSICTASGAVPRAAMLVGKLPARLKPGGKTRLDASSVSVLSPRLAIVRVSSAEAPTDTCPRSTLPVGTSLAFSDMPATKVLPSSTSTCPTVIVQSAGWAE